MESGNYLEGMNANEFGCKAVERWRVGHGQLAWLGFKDDRLMSLIARPSG